MSSSGYVDAASTWARRGSGYRAIGATNESSWSGGIFASWAGGAADSWREYPSKHGSAGRSAAAHIRAHALRLILQKTLDRKILCFMTDPSPALAGLSEHLFRSATVVWLMLLF